MEPEADGLMSIETDTRDRVIRMEADLLNLREDFDEANKKITVMHDLLTQARGARWAIIAMATLGGFIASKVGALIPWFTLPPR